MNIDNIMKVVPVHFIEYNAMLTRYKMFLEKGAIQIDPRFDKLITYLLTAMKNDENLDKQATSFEDGFDAFRLSLNTMNLKNSFISYKSDERFSNLA